MRGTDTKMWGCVGLGDHHPHDEVKKQHAAEGVGQGCAAGKPGMLHCSSYCAGWVRRKQWAESNLLLSQVALQAKHCAVIKGHSREQQEVAVQGRDVAEGGGDPLTSRRSLSGCVAFSGAQVASDVRHCASREPQPATL